MSIYLIPPSSTLSDALEVIQKAGLKIHVFQNVREMILAEGEGPIVIGTLDATGLLILNRHAVSLLEELPTVVMSVPGAIYTGEWVSLASAFPATDWIELSQKLAKSGHLAHTPEQLVKRGVGGPAQTVESVTGLRFKKAAVPEVEEEASDEFSVDE